MVLECGVWWHVVVWRKRVGGVVGNVCFVDVADGCGCWSLLQCEIGGLYFFKRWCEIAFVGLVRG